MMEEWMTYLTFGFENPNEATMETFCSTAAELGYEVRRWPIWGGRVILCAGVPSRDECDVLDLYDALAGLAQADRIPLWLSMGYASEAEWLAGEPL